MGLADLIQAMQELYRRAEAQLQHLEPLERSAQAWAAVLTGLDDTGALLRQKSAEIGPEWPDEAGDLYASRLNRSATTVRAWQQTLAAADLPAAVTNLAAAIRTTFNGVSALWDRFVALLGEAAGAAAGPDPAAAVDALITRLAAIVEEAAGLLRGLDQQFTDAARRVAGAADGTAWDGPAGAGPTGLGSAAGAVVGASTMATAGGSVPTAGAGPATGFPSVGGANAAGAPLGPGGIPEVLPGDGPGLAGVSAPAPIAPAWTTPPSPVATPGALSPPGISPVGFGIPGAGGFSPRRGSGISAGGGSGFSAGRLPAGGIGPVPPGGIPPIAGATGGAIPQAARPPAGSVPLAAAQQPPSAAATPPTPAAAGSGSSRFLPPMLGSGLHGAGGHTDPKPGARDSDHRNRPLRTVPGVPPELRGRTGTLSGTPAFLTGTRRDDEQPAEKEPLDEDLWQTKPPPTPLASPRRRS